MTKFYVNDQGVYLGGFEGAEPPIGAIEVPEPPSDARQIWDGEAWLPLPTKVDQNIRNAPSGLFGGPQLKDLFNGN